MEIMHYINKDEVFDEKYKLYSKMLYRIAYLQLGNSEDAEDALQEVFTKLLYKAPKFKDEQHEKSWLIRITVNQCKDLKKSFFRKYSVSIEDFEIKDNKHFFENDSDIMDEILCLPDTYKAPIYLYYFEDYSVEEISKMLKIGSSAVKMRLQRGRQLLKLELEETYYGQKRLEESN